MDGLLPAAARATLRVAVVDKEIAGFGASGRNGGWCSPNFPVTAGALEKRFGAESARNLLLAMRASVDEVGRVCADEKIDARFHKGGVLTLARGRHQLPAFARVLRPMNGWGWAIATRCLAPRKPATHSCDRRAGGLFTPTARAFIRHGWCAVWRGRWRPAAASSMSRRR